MTTSVPWRGPLVVDVSIPDFAALDGAAVMSMMGEALAYHLPDLRTRWGDYGYLTSQTIATAALLSSADYVQGQRVRRYARRVVAELFGGIDALITPTAAVEAPALASLTDAAWFWGAPIYTSFWNVVGYPAMSTPIGFGAKGLPLGMQIITKPFDEATGFKIGDAYQRLTDFHLRAPLLAQAVPA